MIRTREEDSNANSEWEAHKRLLQSSQARHNLLSEREREDDCGGKVAGGDRTPFWRGGEAEWPEKGGGGVALF